MNIRQLIARLSVEAEIEPNAEVVVTTHAGDPVAEPDFKIRHFQGQPVLVLTPPLNIED